MRQEPSSENCRLVYLTRRAYETGEIRLLLRTDNVCAEKDTGWQLLQGSETAGTVQSRKQPAGLCGTCAGDRAETCAVSDRRYAAAEGGICL